MRTRTQADERTLAWADALLSRAVEADAKAQAARTEQALRTFARNLSFALRVPGVHPSGIHYDELLDILAAHGRDFAADSDRLRKHVEQGLLDEFHGKTATASERRDVAAALILQWVLSRLEGQLRDVPIASNASTYRAWKRKNARYSAPGMRSGALRDAIKSRGQIQIR